MLYFAKMLEKKFPDAKLTESYSGPLIITNKDELPIDKWNDLNVIAAIQPKTNPDSYDDVSQIIFICKYSDPEAVYEEYNFTKDPVILIKLWSVIRHDEQEDASRSFLSGLGNFVIPKILSSREETTFEITYFDLNDTQDDESKADAFIDLICEYFIDHEWVVSIADKDMDPPILRIRIGVYRDPNNGLLKQRMYLLTHDDTKDCILKNSSEGYCGSYYPMNVSDVIKHDSAFGVYGEVWIEQEAKQKEDPSSHRKEYDLETPDCDGKYILILVRDDYVDDYAKKNNLNSVNITVLKKDGYLIEINTIYGDKAFYNERWGIISDYEGRKFMIALRSKAPFIFIEISKDIKEEVGVFDSYEEAKAAYDGISEQNELPDSYFYHYTPYIAQLHFINPNHCVAIYTKEKE